MPRPIRKTMRDRIKALYWQDDRKPMKISKMTGIPYVQVKQVLGLKY